MVENYAGKLLFSDPQRKFVLQQDKIKTLTDKNDIQVGTIGDKDQYLAVKVADRGTLKEDTFQRSTDETDKFACMKTDYKKLDPANLFSYVRGLLSEYDVNSNVLNKPQSYYTADKTNGFKEITKDEFYRS